MNTIISEYAKSSKNKDLEESDFQVFEAILKKIPTGGNSKPFSWFWRGQELTIIHNSQLAEHYLNRNQHTSLISFGAILKALELTSSSLGLKHHFEIDIQNLTLRAHFVRESLQKDFSCLDQLLNRKTFRGSFDIPSPAATLNLDKKIFPLIFDSKDWRSYLLQASLYIWFHKKACIDFFKEIRFFSKKSSTEKRGIPLQELMLHWQDQMSLFFFSLIPSFLPLILKVPGLKNLFLKNTTTNLQNAHFVLLTVRSTDQKELVDLGGRMMTLWLDLEKQGYLVQPYSTASIPVFDALSGHLPKDTQVFFQNLFTQTGPEVMKECFQIHESEIPVWLFRYGKTCEKGSARG